MDARRRVAILGGGPVGIAALLRARAEGWDAHLYERGRIGESVRAWGHVRMFSPLGMNRLDGAPAVDGDVLLTGSEYVELCLEPVARDRRLAGRLHVSTEVVAVSRARLRKVDEIASPARAERPFELLLEGPDGERVAEADVVLDATGTFATPNWLGRGGMPAVGERAAAKGIRYRLPDIPGRDREAFAGRHTLLIGAGHSAATAVAWLADLARERPGTRVTWITRTGAARPVPDVVEDPLPERARTVGAANELATRGAPWLERRASATLVEVRRRREGFAVALEHGAGASWVEADRMLALVGYRPDLELARELQIQTCWATEGTYPLAAALLTQAGGTGGDCLRSGSLDSSTLVHPEPDFFTLGAKSYGRNPNFLIRAGLQQVEQVFSLLRRRAI